MTAFKLGDRVTKTKGSSWTGTVVGTYSTSLTPEGYAVESDTEVGSVQIYPAKALCAPETAPTAPNTPAGYSDEVVGRISRALRAYARNDPSLILTGNSIAAELYALADLLPEPVDPDLIAAREADAKAAEANDFHEYAAACRAGKNDDGPVRHRYEGIKLGRALAAEGR